MALTETLNIKFSPADKREVAKETWLGLGQIRDEARRTGLEHGFVSGTSITNNTFVSSDIFPGSVEDINLGTAYDQVTGAQAIPLVQAHVHPGGLFRFSPQDLTQWSGLDQRIVVPVDPGGDNFELELKQTINHRPISVVVSLHKNTDRIIALAQTKPNVDLDPFVTSGLNPAMINIRHRESLLEASLKGEEPDFAALYGIALLVTTLNAEGKDDLETFMQDHMPAVISLKPYQLEV